MSFLESQAYGYAGGTLTLWGVFAGLSQGRSGDRALLAVLALATLLCLLYGLWLTGLRWRQERAQAAWRVRARAATPRGRPAGFGEARGRRGASQRCPYCHDGLRGGALLECRGCRATLHAECAAELGGCPTIGCRGRREPTAGGSHRLELRLRESGRRVA